MITRYKINYLYCTVTALTQVNTLTHCPGQFNKRSPLCSLTTRNALMTRQTRSHTSSWRANMMVTVQRALIWLSDP
jgi:hypothetical protein